MSDHTHTVQTVVPLTPEVAAALADPLLLVVINQDARSFTWHAPNLTPGIVGLALAEFAADVCRDHPATLEERRLFTAGGK